MKLAISSGHSHRDPGAVGFMRERNENVRVADALAALVNAMPGHDAVLYHDETSKSSRQNVNETAQWHNRQTRDLDVQIHFNAFKTTQAPRGTEMLYVTHGTRERAAAVSKAVADAGDFLDRGAKHRTNLGFLNQTQKPAILTEICFVDSAADVRNYQAHFDAIVIALAEALVEP